jgi:hypothetical protein
MADALTAEAFEFAEAGVDHEAGIALNEAAIYNSVVRYIDEATTSLDFVFSRADDGPFDLAFVEVEDGNGRSVSAGSWFRRSDGYDVLRVDLLSAPEVAPPAIVPESVMQQLRDAQQDVEKSIKPEPLTEGELEVERLVNSSRVVRLDAEKGVVTIGRWPRRKKFDSRLIVAAEMKRRAGA